MDPNNNQVSNQTFEGYDLLEQVGRGSYGVVWKAIHQRTQVPVAIKRIRKPKPSSIRELEVLKLMSHPKITKLLQAHVTVSQQDFWFVLEFCPTDLARMMHPDGNKRQYAVIAEHQCRSIIEQLLQALHYIHDQGVIHRDIKPDNILLDAQGQVKVADFGLAANCSKNKEQLNQQNAQAGTMTYMAPEVLKIPRCYGPKVDLWSTGVILYEMLFGTHPFPSARYSTPGSSDDFEDPLPQEIEDGLFEQPPKNHTRSNEAVDLWASLMKMNPTERFSAEDAMKHSWFPSSQEEKHQSDNSSEDPTRESQIRDAWFNMFPELGRIEKNLELCLQGYDYYRATYELLKSTVK